MPKRRKFTFTLAPAKNHGETGHTLGVNCSTPLPDKQTLLTGGRDGEIYYWSLAPTPGTLSAAPLHVHPYPHADWVNDILALPGNSGTFVTASADHTICLRNHETILAACRQHAGSVKKINTLRGSRSLLVCSVAADGYCMFHDTERELATVGAVRVGKPAYAVAPSPTADGCVYVGAADGSLFLVDCRAKAPQAAIAGQIADHVGNAHGDAMRDLVFRGSTTLLSASSDSLVKVWDTRQISAPMLSMELHSDVVRSLVVLPKTYILLSASRDGTIVATNLRTLQASKLISLSFPPLHMTVENDVLFVGTTSSTVECFGLAQILSEDLRVAKKPLVNPIGDLIGNTPARHEFTQGISPSRITLQAADVAPVVDLVEVDDQLFQFPDITGVLYPDEASKLQWCSARTAAWRGQTMPEPDFRLGGKPGVCQCELLNTKRHVLAENTDGTCILWDIVEKVMVKRFPHGTDFNKTISNLNAPFPSHVPAWCYVDCKWGKVCVTLVAEDFLNAVVSEWEFTNFDRILDKAVMSSSGTSNPLSQLSIFTTNRTTRFEQRRAGLVNLGDVVLRKLFESEPAAPAAVDVQRRPSAVLPHHSVDVGVVVWSTPNHYTENDRSAAIRIPLSICTSEYQPNDARIPTWIHASIRHAAPELPASSQTKVIVQCLPFSSKCNELPEFSRNRLQVPRSAPLLDIIIAIAKELKLSSTRLPIFREVNQVLGETGLPLLRGDGDPNDENPVTVEEYIQLVSVVDKETVLDPLMSTFAAYVSHKEKMAPHLTLLYRPIVPGLARHK